MLYDLGLIGPKTPGITWQMDTISSTRKQFFDAGFLNNNAVNNIGSNVL